MFPAAGRHVVSQLQTTSGLSQSSTMRTGVPGPSLRVVPIIALLFAISVPVNAQGRDSVSVVSVTPAGPLHRGVPTEVVVVVDVVLATMDTAQLAAGFNTDDAKRYRMGADAALHRGHQRITLRVTVVPVDWSAQGSTFPTS